MHEWVDAFLAGSLMVLQHCVTSSSIAKLHRHFASATLIDKRVMQQSESACLVTAMHLSTHVHRLTLPLPE